MTSIEGHWCLNTCRTLALAIPHPAARGSGARFALWGQKKSELSVKRLKCTVPLGSYN